MLYTGSSRAEAGRIQRIGLATSADLNSWVKHDGPVLEALAPVTEPGAGFGQMEVPQLVEHGGRCYLLFCSDAETQAPAGGPPAPVRGRTT